MKNVLAFCAVTAAVLTFGASANALTITALNAGVGASSLSNSVRNANGLTAGLADFNTPPSVTTYGNSAPPQGPFSQDGASFDGFGILMFNTPGGTGPSDGLYAEPYHDTTQYLTVQPNGQTETVDFGGADYTTLGLYWGSMDTYNSISFFEGASSVAVATVTGSDAAGAVPSPANGDQTDDANNRYIVISGLPAFTNIVLTSTSNSFEIDNLAWGPGASGILPTPIPAALPLFGSVLGGGLLFRNLRRKRKAA